MGRRITQFARNVAYAFICPPQQFASYGKPAQAHILLRTLSGLVPQQVFKIALGKAVHAGEISGCGHTSLQDLSRQEIIVENLFRLRQYAFVFLVPGDELPLVKAAAVIEQQLYAVDQYRPAVFVHTPPQFFGYAVHARLYNAFLAARQVQGLIAAVIEERIIGKMPLQLCVMNQSAVEAQQQAPTSPAAAPEIHIQHLSRSYERQHTVREIAFFPSGTVAARFPVEQHGVKLHLQQIVAFHIGKVRNAHQRM